MTSASLGVAMALMAGILNGSFAVPMKYATRWKWENVWTLWSVVALLLVPWILALATIPDLFNFYRNSGSGTLLLLLGFGAGFGFAQVLFGLGLAAVGLSLGFALTIGLSTAVGSLLPLLILQPHAFLTSTGLIILAVVASIRLGRVVCPVAGTQKYRIT